MNIKKFIITLLASATLVLCIGVTSFADLGNFNDYDAGGGSDWSSGNDWGDSGYSSGWGDSDDWSNSDYGDYSNSSSDGSFIDFAIAAVVVIVILAVFMYKQRHSSTSVNKQTNTAANVNIPNHTQDITAEIVKEDPNFDYDAFISWVKEAFITLQNSWSERDFEKCRYFEKEELFEQHNKQIQQYINEGKINVLDRINVNQCYLYSYTVKNDIEYLGVCINARMTDYVIDEKTKKVVKGDPNTEYHLKYIYTFTRKAGTKTAVADGSQEIACPHCGAPTKVSSSGKCEYCGFIIKTDAYNWVLSDIEAVKNGYVPDGGGVKKQ